MHLLDIDARFTNISQDLWDEAHDALDRLLEGRGVGNELRGWLTLPQEASASFIEEIKECANRLRESCECVVCVGIGGSYCGAQAIIEALMPPFFNRTKTPLLYAGNHLGARYQAELEKFLFGKTFGIIYISKSGGTLEPSLAFHQLRKLLIANVGVEEAQKRIIVITDPERGTLRKLQKKEGYTSFSIPPSVGGRYSVLSAVGLLPIAYEGVDITEFLKGALSFATAIARREPSTIHTVLSYAGWRIGEYRKGKKIEIFATFTPQLRALQEWWKQLFAETEGKGGKGIFSTTATFTTDLHSLGQWIQDGERTIMETVLSVQKADADIHIANEDDSQGALAFLNGKSLHWINRQTEEATCLAHNQGGVPVFKILLEQLDAYHLGALIYYLELVAAVSGYLMNINPFDQPGVEAYKQRMNQLLKDPIAK